jgi:ferredoxin
MVKIKIKRDLCCGAGLCVQIAPDVFRLDALGYNNSDGDNVPPAKQAAAQKAARACPESAIHLVNVDAEAQ